MSEKTYTLAEVRAAFKRGADYGASSFGIPDVEKVARDCYPDPEPERRWVKMINSYEHTRNPDGTWRARYIDGPEFDAGLTDERVAAIASLLPRVPVEVTQEMVMKAKRGYLNDLGDLDNSLHAALSAVAADLAQPVATCQHKAQWWATVSDSGEHGIFHRNKAEAEDRRSSYDQHYPDCAPHRVVALAEVE